MHSYHPDRDDQVIAVESAEFIGHAKNGADAQLEGGFVDHVKDTGETCVWHSGLFNFQRAKPAVALEDDIDLFSVTVAVEVEVRLQPRILIALHDFRHGVVFQQRTAHGAALGHLWGGPACEIADKAGIVEIDFRRLDRALEDIVGIGMQQEDDSQRFQNVDPRLGDVDVDAGVLCQRVIIQKLRATGGDSGDKAVELQRVHIPGELPHIALNVGGEV